MAILNILNIFTIIFVILKVTGAIAWSWFWVLFPTLVFWALFAVLIIKAYIDVTVDEARYWKDINESGKNNGDKGQ